MRLGIGITAGFPAFRGAWLLGGLAIAPLQVSAVSPQEAYFETHIRPLLAEQCFECHSEKAGKRKGGLWLDRREGWSVGGDSGPAIVPGDPDQSLLIQAVRYHEPKLEMPPDNPLAPSEVAVLETWIRDGAFDPRSEALAQPSGTSVLEAAESLWSLQPLSDPAPPTVGEAEPQTPIDAFLERRRREAGIEEHAAPAEPPALLRRLTFDLTGLPPTLEQQESFMSDPSREALEKLVDDLLASRAFAERWARHWLDITRYADSSGGGRAIPLTDAWRFRDYVVDAFHQDLPLDQLIREHLAGDLLPASSKDERIRQLTGTGFLVLGPHNYENQDKDMLDLEIADEQLDTIGRAFLGMTIGCARCHDHMFDPIPARDYYAMAGIFLSTKSVQHSNVSRWHQAELPPPPKLAARITAFREQEQALVERIETLRDLAGEKDAPNETAKEELKKKEAALKELRKKKPEPPAVMAVADHSKPSDTPLRVRGMPRNLGEVVPRGFLSAVHLGHETPAIENGSGRLEFAQWITHAGHPLTPRVLANRIWLKLFGEGLVPTPDNFGTTGEPPTHPELLDWLSRRLLDSGWSAKSLIRELVLTDAYALATNPSPGVRQAAEAIDLENRLLWRSHLRPVDAEALRDAMLLISDTLEPSTGGPVLPENFKSEFQHRFTTKKRSLYVPAFRNATYDLFQVFNAANPNFVVGKRPRTVVPTQSLYLRNSPFVQETAAAAADRVLKFEAASDEARIDLAFRLCLGRLPSETERTLALDLLRAEGDTATENRVEAWNSLICGLFACVDFRFLP